MVFLFSFRKKNDIARITYLFFFSQIKILNSNITTKNKNQIISLDQFIICHANEQIKMVTRSPPYSNINFTGKKEKEFYCVPSYI